MMLTKRRGSSEKLSDQDGASDDSSKGKKSKDDVLKSTNVHNVYSDRRVNFITCLLLITLVIVTYNVYLSDRTQSIINQRMMNISSSIRDVEVTYLNIRKPLVCILVANSNWRYLIHIREIFKRLNYEVIRDIDQNWDVLWSHGYPPANLTLKPHQKVNHFPGTNLITSKVILSTLGLPFIPKSFFIPDGFKTSRIFMVKKNLGHRGVQIQRIEEMNFTRSFYFIQEFIQNPLLIDGRKFDLGVYVYHTSIDPLRVYTFDEEAQLRFCTENYRPFDSRNTNSYVIGDKYTPTWLMPSLNTSYVTNNVTKKESLNIYLRSIGKDPEAMWKRVEDMIAKVYLHQEAKLVESFKSSYSTSRHFFELTRFDFIVDEDLNPYLLESNMSPNLATPRLPRNQYMFEKVIYNHLSLSGLARTDGTHDWHRYDGSKWNLRVHDRDLVVNEELCSSKECESSCGSDKCRSCFHCLSDEMKLHLKDAFLEQKSIWSAKRLLPSTSDDDLNSKTDNNKVQTDWFKAKCKSYPNWCSR